MGNANFICYQGYEWTRSLQFLSCGLPIDLTGYGIAFTVKDRIGGATLAALTIGSGITVDIATATATLTLTGAETTALSTTGLPTLAVTEIMSADCCSSGLMQSDTKIGPTAICELVLTQPDGSALPPEFIGSFLVYPQL